MADNRSLAERATLIAPATPRWVPWGAGLLGLGLTVLSVALENNQAFTARLTREIAGILSPLPFAAAGVGALLEGWRRRQWRRLTQFLAVEAVDQLLDALTNLAETVMDLLKPALPEIELNRLDVREAFALPYTKIRIAAFAESTAAVLPLKLAFTSLSTGVPLVSSSDDRDFEEALASAVGMTPEDLDPPVSLPEDPDDLAHVVQGLLDRGTEAAETLDSYAAQALLSGSDLSTLLAPDVPDLIREVLVLEQDVGALQRVIAEGRSTKTPTPSTGSELLDAAHAVLRQCSICMHDLSYADQSIRKRGTKQLPEFLKAISAAGGIAVAITEESLSQRIQANARHRQYLRLRGDGAGVIRRIPERTEREAGRTEIQAHLDEGDEALRSDDQIETER